MKHDTRRYLSARIRIIICAQYVAGVLAAILYAVLFAAQGAPIYPAFIFLLVPVLFGVLFHVWIDRPFRQIERMLGLYLEGYTLSGIDGAEGMHLSPASEQLLGRVKEEFNTANLLKLSKRQAQYRALQNQINPHFLYNTLESIRGEALIAGLDSVAEMTEALAVFFRYTISKVETLVSVEEELQNCETYFHIQQYRFGSRIQFDIDCAPEDRDTIYRCRIPKLTLQPILENSIIHGIEFKLGTGHLTVHLERTGSMLLIRIEDDGVGMDERALSKLNDRLDKSGRQFQDGAAEHGGSIALINVNNRIHLIFGEQYGLHVYSMPGMGTDVHISLPIITSERDLPTREGL